MADQADTLSIPTNPVRPAAGVTMPSPRVPDLVRPGAEPSSAAPSLNQRVDQPVGLRDNEVEARKLIVGRGTSLSGGVASCDRLVVEGSIEANLKNCQNMIIAETGIFRGNGSTENADVRGRIEGDLVVYKRLLIRASGHVSGTITYGEIEIEAGGRISGAIQAHEGPKGQGTIAASLPHRRPQ